MGQKSDPNKELIRALLWAYLGLPLLNTVVQIVYFVVMLGVSENQGDMIAQIYNLTLPAVGVVVTQIFNWQLGGLFLMSLFSRYLSFLLLTLLAPVVRFAALRRSIKNTPLSLILALASLGLGALIHSFLFEPLLDPKSGPMDFVVQMPEYATIMFAFFATLSIIRHGPTSKGRVIKEDESFAYSRRPTVQPRVAPPLRLTFDDPFSDREISVGGENSAGTIIGGSAHFGPKEDPEPAGVHSFSRQDATVDMPPVNLREETKTASEAQAPTVRDIPKQDFSGRASAPRPQEEQPDAMRGDAARQGSPAFPSDDALNQPSFPASAPMPEPIRVQNAAAPASVPSPPPLAAPEPKPDPTADIAKSLPDDFVSLLLDKTSASADGAHESLPQNEVSHSPLPAAEAKSLPDDLAALLKEIQVPRAARSEAAKLPVSREALPASDGETSADDLTAMLKELQTQYEAGINDGAAIATLEDILPLVKPAPQGKPAPEPRTHPTAQEPAPEPRTHPTAQEPVPVPQTHPTAQEPVPVPLVEPPAAANACLLCGDPDAGLDSIAMPDGTFIHRSCYVRVLEKMSSLKTEEETAAFFQKSPGLMKVIFLANTALLPGSTPMTEPALGKTNEPKEDAPKKRRTRKRTTE